MSLGIFLRKMCAAQSQSLLKATKNLSKYQIDHGLSRSRSYRLAGNWTTDDEVPAIRMAGYVAYIVVVGGWYGWHVLFAAEAK